MLFLFWILNHFVLDLQPCLYSIEYKQGIMNSNAPELCEIDFLKNAVDKNLSFYYNIHIKGIRNRNVRVRGKIIAVQRMCCLHLLLRRLGKVKS